MHEMKMNDGTQSKKLKHQFSQVERDLNLQKMFKLIPIPKKNTKEKQFVISCTSTHELHTMSVYKTFIHSLYLRKQCYFQCEEVSNSTFNLLQIGPSTFKDLVPGSLSKMTLNVLSHMVWSLNSNVRLMLRMLKLTISSHLK